MATTLTKDDIKTLQGALGVTQDGILGPVTIKALQTKLGVKVDGKIGPVTISALQKRLGVTADGKLGPVTLGALRKYMPGVLSKGTFVVATPGLTPSISTVHFNTQKLALAGMGIAGAWLLAFASRSGSRYA